MKLKVFGVIGCLLLHWPLDELLTPSLINAVRGSSMDSISVELMLL